MRGLDEVTVMDQVTFRRKQSGASITAKFVQRRRARESSLPLPSSSIVDNEYAVEVFQHLHFLALIDQSYSCSVSQEKSASTLYISASTNRHSRVADVSCSNLIAFGSGRLVALWKPNVRLYKHKCTL